MGKALQGWHENKNTQIRGKKNMIFFEKILTCGDAVQGLLKCKKIF